MKNKKTTNVKVDFIEWLTCPYCKKLIVSGHREMVGNLLRWRKQSDRKVSKLFKK